MIDSSVSSPQSDAFNQQLLNSFSSGKVFIIHNDFTGLILRKEYSAELINTGSAVGGQFDSQVTGIYAIGDVEITIPKNRLELQQSISSRQADIDQMLSFYRERDLLQRTISILQMLHDRYGYQKVKSIPLDLLALLVGTNEELINRAWDKLFSINTVSTTVKDQFHISALDTIGIATLELPTPKEELKPKNWLWILVAGGAAIATIAIGIGALVYWKSGQSSAVSPLVSKTSEPPSVSAQGYIEPEGEVIQLSAPAFVEGARVEQLLVRQAQSIPKGAIVAILDSRDRLQAALDQARKGAEIAEAKLIQVRAGAKSGDINAQKAQYGKSKAELEGQVNAQKATIANLEAELEGERSTQEAVILQTRAELSNARTECGRYQTLYKAGAVSASQKDTTCLNQSTNQERLAQATATLKRIINSRQTQIQEAQANLTRTIETLGNEIKATASSRDAVAEVRNVDVQVAEQELESARADIRKAAADLAQAYVRSPIDGEILKINTWPGELVKQDKGIVEMGHTSQMYVNAEVYETDIPRIRKGQQATIRADGVVGVLQGTVDQIGLRIGRPNTLGTDPVKDVDVRVVEVKIRLAPEDSRKVKTLTNLQVNVVIKIDSWAPRKIESVVPKQDPCPKMRSQRA